MVAYPRNLTITDRFTEIKKEIGALALTAGHNGRESESLFGYKPYRWIFCPVAYNDITDFEKVNLLEKWTYGPLYECIPIKGFFDNHENNILYDPINGNPHKFPSDIALIGIIKTPINQFKGGDLLFGEGIKKLPLLVPNISFTKKEQNNVFIVGYPAIANISKTFPQIFAKDYVKTIDITDEQLANQFYNFYHKTLSHGIIMSNHITKNNKNNNNNNRLKKNTITQEFFRHELMAISASTTGGYSGSPQIDVDFVLGFNGILVGGAIQSKNISEMMVKDLNHNLSISINQKDVVKILSYVSKHIYKEDITEEQAEYWNQFLHFHHKKEIFFF